MLVKNFKYFIIINLKDAYFKVAKIKKLNVFCLTRLPFLYYIKSKKVLKTLLFVIYTCFL